ncbi:hypothetical protein C2E23DRAFT_134565 [Lenzites betulinus]|nr:hypothetical protein C2E23DRAFT_134565 [Lenzites betulinus]
MMDHTLGITTCSKSQIAGCQIQTVARCRPLADHSKIRLAGDTSAAAVAALYQFMRTANTCGIAATVMLVYDYVLCLDREYQYVWRSRKSKASRLVYLYIRYISLLEYVTGLVTIPPVSDTRFVQS